MPLVQTRRRRQISHCAGSATTAEDKTQLWPPSVVRRLRKVPRRSASGSVCCVGHTALTRAKFKQPSELVAASLSTVNAGLGNSFSSKLLRPLPVSHRGGHSTTRGSGPRNCSTRPAAYALAPSASKLSDFRSPVCDESAATAPPWGLPEDAIPMSNFLALLHIVTCLEPINDAAS